MLSALLFAFFALISLATSALGGTPPLDWNHEGYTLDRPLYDGHETGWHVKDPREGYHHLGYGYSGNDKKGYDFKNRGFAQLLAVDLDFYAEFEFKHFQIFEYSKSREINYTASVVDASADQANRVAEQARTAIDSPHLDEATKAQVDAAGKDGTAVDANHQSGTIRDELSLTAKQYDELKFKLKTKVEIDDLLQQKRLRGQSARFYGHIDAAHQ